MTKHDDARDSWWGQFRIPVGTSGCWRVGPLSLFINREDGEWRIATKASDDHLDPTVRVEIPTAVEDFLAQDKVTRYAISGDDDRITLAPLLADRPIISRPEKPFVVLPEDEITVYISTPLWVLISAGESEKRLMEVPAYRPSDTWFGPDTMTGELCYAGRASMRLHLEQLPLRPHRATSAVTIRNLKRDPLTIERLNLPVVHLSLYQGPDFELWTDNITFERPRDGDVIKLRLRDSVGRSAFEGAQKLSPAREPLSDRLAVRALGSLFG